MKFKHFVPYGSYDTACGLSVPPIKAARLNTTDERKLTTCGYCQAQMTDLGDFPPIEKGGY